MQNDLCAYFFTELLRGFTEKRNSIYFFAFSKPVHAGFIGLVNRFSRLIHSGTIDFILLM